MVEILNEKLLLLIFGYIMFQFLSVVVDFFIIKNFKVE